MYIATAVCHALHVYSTPLTRKWLSGSCTFHPNELDRSQSNRIGHSGRQLSDDVGIPGELVVGGLQALCE